jgi:hypothetical protein
MLRIFIGILFVSLFSSSALATECGIKLGGGGKDSSWIKLKNNKITRVNDIGGPWSYIRKTKGPCSFSLYNKDDFKGRNANYGTDIKPSLRIGIKDGIDKTRGSITGEDKKGWKVRSLIIIPEKTLCKIQIEELDTRGFKSSIVYTMRQTFHGPARISNISGWSFVGAISGAKNCQYKLYNGPNFDRKFINIERVDSSYRVGWRIRSIEITNSGTEANSRPSPSPASPPRSGQSYSEIRHIKGRCLDVAGGVNRNKTNIQIHACNGSNSQKWRWTNKQEIKNIMGLCLDVSGGVNADNTNIQLYRCNGSKSQKWQTISNKRIKNVMGRCLDVVNGINANKTNVQLYRCKNVDAQQWR